jgi:hypothetical protein
MAAKTAGWRERMFAVGVVSTCGPFFFQKGPVTGR